MERNMSNVYVVFYYGEDGDQVKPEFFTKRQLEEKLNDSDWGENVKILSGTSNFEYDTGLLIIKGEVVQPKSVQIVQKWELE